MASNLVTNAALVGARVDTGRRNRPGGRIDGFRIFTYVFLTVLAIVYIAPFFFMIGKSVMTQFEAGNTPNIIPSTIQLQNFSDVWTSRNYGTYLWNTIRLVFIAIVGQTTICVLAAYAFARMKFPGRDLIFGLFLMTLFVPAIITLVPKLILVTRISQAFEAIHPSLKWMDNWPALTIPFLANTFSIFLLRQFFKQIPDELWDAARIDGSGHLRYLWQIIVPISRATVMTTVLFCFIGTWSALDWPILVTASNDWRPIAVALQQFSADGGELTHLKMAAALIAMLPVLVLYFFTQKQFTEGISTTGLKG